MKYRLLGNTGIAVSEIGMGCWGIGGDAYGKTDDDESRLTLETAFLNGINFYDTSDIYGNGHSEELLGEVFASRRYQVVIATKGGCLPHTKPPMPQDFSEKHLREALDGSLRRLKTDYIDLYQLHSPLYPEFLEEGALTLEKLKQEGKIRLAGVSLNSPLNAYFVPVVDAIQTNFSMIDQRAHNNGLIDDCKQYGIGLIARTPLCFGFLGDRDGPGTTWIEFEEGDHRNNWSMEQRVLWSNASSEFAHLYSDRTPVQFALGFCLSYPISTTIPGMMYVDEVLENIKATALDDNEIQEIEHIYSEHEFYLGGKNRK